ncbi:1587_t:CDS:2 [Cetraspora pellucida]|uniref:1587_t:CDS:1 n=1 Tax=Cetraspora pellucida TaxID=1433469 RepID=A0ACA9LIF9_9GLOM|nr:1587_t:CDS:2 [Cetraspora pellucida]
MENMGKNYLEQAKNIENLVKNKEVDILVWETSFWWKTNKAQKDLQELVYLNGVLGYLGDKHNCQTQTIINHTVKEVENKKVIAGLVKKDKHFKGRIINEHERDALLVFWIY